ncbi:MAG: phage holin family protein [Ruthenibacterium sp.]
MEELQQYIQPELLVTIPLLYMLGIWLKRSAWFHDEKIPLTLGGFGILMALFYTLSTVPITNYQSIFSIAFAAITQGLLCAGASVYANQLWKQQRLSKALPPDKK